MSSVHIVNQRIAAMPDPAPYKSWKEAVANKESARRLLSLIGKQERTTADSRAVGGRFGHLKAVDVTATIYYQETDGAQNYHKDTAFNVALATVIKERFTELAAEAEALLDLQEVHARCAMRVFVDELDSEVAEAEKS